MHEFMYVVTAALAVGLVTPATVSAASPQEDLKAFQDHYMTKFPEVGKAGFMDGVYALNKDFCEQWENTEEFPPYEEYVEKGEEMFNTPFANGKTYAKCLPNGGKGIRQMYPYFDTDGGEIKTLEGEINTCREANGEKPLKYSKGPITNPTAYIAYTSRGNKYDIKVPNDARAVTAHEKGKKHFFMKRGQRMAAVHSPAQPVTKATSATHAYRPVLSIGFSKRCMDITNYSPMHKGPVVGFGQGRS